MSHARFTLAVVLLTSCLLATDSTRAQEPTAPALRWFKGNLHTHSLWSDGNDFPEMIVDWYKRGGYHFLALSDHNILSEGEKWMDVEVAAKRGAIGGLDRYRERFGASWVQTREKDGKQQVRLKPLNEFRPLFDEPGRFALLQGEEITDSAMNLPIHINASNIRDVIKPQGGKTVRETIANNLIAVQQQSQRIGQPILAHLNHPNYGYAVTAEDLAEVLEEQYFEIYNGHPDVKQQGDKHHVSMEQMWDIANTIRISELKGPPLSGLATDDSHNYFGERGASPGRGWIMVHAAFLTPPHLIQAIARGDFYASTGVELDRIVFDEKANLIQIDVKAKPGVKYVTEFLGTRKGFDRTSEPIVGEDGKPIQATRKYSADVGRVLAQVEGPQARYQLKGDELYVRAVVTSTEKPTNASFDEQRQQAWTQPVGWRKWVPDAPAPKPAAPPEGKPESPAKDAAKETNSK